MDLFDRKHLASDFSLYLHRPTATDPTLAPPGCDCWYVLAPVPNLDSEDIPNLYCVGAGTHPGAGLPGVMSSGKIVAEMMGRAE